MIQQLVALVHASHKAYQFAWNVIRQLRANFILTTADRYGINASLYFLSRCLVSVHDKQTSRQLLTIDTRINF